MLDMSAVRAWAELVRDVGLIIGIPVLITIGVKLYGQQIEVLKSRNELLKETQYDRALDIIKSQRELFELERGSLEKKLRTLESQSNTALADKEREIEALKARLSTVKETISNLESSASVVKRAGFELALFRSDAEFRSSLFQGRANFADTSFRSDTSFDRSLFSGTVTFRDAAFGGRANFSGADLSRATFTNANLSGTSFDDADLRGADLSRALIDHSTRLPPSVVKMDV